MTEGLFWLYCKGIQSLMVGEDLDGSRYIVSSQGEKPTVIAQLLSPFPFILWDSTEWCH